MNQLKLSETDLFLGWLFEKNNLFYEIVRNSISIESYDSGITRVLHFTEGKCNFSTHEENLISKLWNQYVETYRVPVNKFSLLDVSTWTLNEIFNKFSGQFSKLSLVNRSSIFGRFNTLHYTPKPNDSFPGTRPTIICFEKFPNFYSDLDQLSSVTERILIVKGQIKNVIPVMMDSVSYVSFSGV